MGFLRLLLGTLVLRPYVFVFLAVYLVAAVTRMGWAKTAAFSAVAWAIAYAAEFSSTRNGFPFGAYRYFDATRTRELWIADVPFWDSLSFVFLSYFSFALAAAVLSPREALGRASGAGGDRTDSLSPVGGEGNLR